MKFDIEILINTKFVDIQMSGELTLKLMNVYSKLFLNGSRPSLCTACMRNYHIQIINIGYQKLEKLEKMKEKTFILKPGLHFVRTESKHYTNENLSEEKAIELLNNKHLRANQFEVLPEDYEPVEVVEIALLEENKGKFSQENLEALNGNDVIKFAKEFTEDKPQNKKDAIDSILNWQK